MIFCIKASGSVAVKGFVIRTIEKYEISGFCLAAGGFKIAMRDLEIRGAGNLLGPEQSGYLMSVGYDLYLKLLEEAVLEERGEEREAECAADLTVNANIPLEYVPDGGQRMDVYRRIAAIRTQEDASDLIDELLDRYGEVPKPVLALIDVALLRAMAAREGISDITQKGEEVRLTLSAFHPEAIVALCGLHKYRRRLTLSSGSTPLLTLRVKQNALDEARELVEDLRLSRDSGEAEQEKVRLAFRLKTELMKNTKMESERLAMKSMHSFLYAFIKR